VISFITDSIISDLALVVSTAYSVLAYRFPYLKGVLPVGLFFSFLSIIRRTNSQLMLILCNLVLFSFFIYIEL
ncbi:hypothetical protein, partial [Klebsiella variicola]|uniref:hypothetical protein n=1 Tax=Klebsiella variicola TaxID=244366 RepID=UPI002730984D